MIQTGTGSEAGPGEDGRSARGGASPSGIWDRSDVWARLVEENVGWVRGWIRGRVNDVDTADEICQETFLKALRAKRTLKDVSKFPTWLYRIATNSLRDHLRRKRRREERLLLSGELDAVPGGPASTDTVGEAEDIDRLLVAVGELPPRYREPLLLRHAEDLSYAEIARILGLRENAVQVRVFRARRMLRERLESQERRGNAPGE